VVVVLVREVLIAIAALFVAAAGGRRIDVLWVGKAGTLAIMFALPMLLGADAVSGFWRGFLAFGGWCFAIGGVLLSYYAAILYVPAARNAIREGRANRMAPEVST
jgi:cardiolipin synthase (CMP-forming)